MPQHFCLGQGFEKLMPLARPTEKSNVECYTTSQCVRLNGHLGRKKAQSESLLTGLLKLLPPTSSCLLEPIKYSCVLYTILYMGMAKGGSLSDLCKLPGLCHNKSQQAFLCRN